MRLQTSSFVFAAFLACLLTPTVAFAQAQDSAERARGQSASVALCADCHAVKPGDVSPDPKALSFQQIAETKGMTRLALSVWLHSSHPTMPLIRLESDTADDVSSYILSLKRPDAER